MSDILKYAIPAVIVLIILLIAGYFVLRFLRGSIKIAMSKNAFSPGEKVTGTFELTTRKPIEGNRLYAALIGERVTRERRDDRDHTRVEEVFRSEQTLEDAKSYPAGHSQQYTFEIDTPAAGAGPDFLNSGVGKALQAGLNVLTGGRTSYRWKVEVRLDAKGIDLASSRSVSVNLPSGM